MKTKLHILSITGSLLIFFSAVNCKPKEKYYSTIGTIHTPFHITYQYSSSLDKQIKSTFTQYYQSLNVFDSSSVVSKVNRNEEVEVDSFFISSFNTAMEVSEQTDGMFDITCAPLINLWGFGFCRMDSITSQTIDSIRTFVGFRKVRLKGNRVIKDDPRTLLNFSAVSHGFICDVIASMFDNKGIPNYLVEIGGEVMVKGVNPDNKNWRIGIVKPAGDTLDTNRKLEQAVKLKGRIGFATSGDYRNFYVKDGKKYAYILNPLTGYPATQDILSATVIANNCTLADAYATAFIAMGTEQVRTLKRKHPTFEYFIVYTDKKGKYCTEHSEGMKKYLSD